MRHRWPLMGSDSSHRSSMRRSPACWGRDARGRPCLCFSAEASKTSACRAFATRRIRRPCSADAEQSSLNVKDRPSVVIADCVHSNACCHASRAHVVTRALRSVLVALATATACSAFGWAGLLRPADDHGVHRVSLAAVPLPWPVSRAPRRCVALQSLPHPRSRAGVTASSCPLVVGGVRTRSRPRGFAPRERPLRSPRGFPRATPAALLGFPVLVARSASSELGACASPGLRGASSPERWSAMPKPPRPRSWCHTHPPMPHGWLTDEWATWRSCRDQASRATRLPWIFGCVGTPDPTRISACRAHDAAVSAAEAAFPTCPADKSTGECAAPCAPEPPSFSEERRGPHRVLQTTARRVVPSASIRMLTATRRPRCSDRW